MDSKENINRSLNDFKQRLKRNYLQQNTIEQLFFPDQPQLIDDLYVNLQVVEDKKQKLKEESFSISNTHKQMLKQHNRTKIISIYENIYETDSSIKYEEIFNHKDIAGKPERRILIEGRGGIGKSILCQKLAYEWASGKLWQEDFAWVFWIKLREINHSRYASNINNIDFIDFINNECFYYGGFELFNDVEKRMLSFEMRRHPQKTLWLLDGYDELDPNLQKSKLWSDLCKFNTVIITSRPNNLKDINNYLHLEVIGFNENQIHTYINKFYHNLFKNISDKNVKLGNGSSKNLLEKNLHEVIVQKTNIKGIIHIPLVLNLTCSIASLGQSITFENMTGFYQSIVNALFKRYVKKVFPNLQILTDNLINQKCMLIQHFLESLAFAGMCNYSIMLSSKELDKAFEEFAKINTFSLDILQTLGQNGFLKIVNESQCYFIHLSFQEYFAACFVVRQLMSASKGEQSKILAFIRGNKCEPRYETMWWFVSGLLGIQEKTKHEAKEVLELFFKCLLDEPYTLHKIHQICFMVRCLDEAGLPAFLVNYDEIIRQFRWYTDQLDTDKYTSGYFSKIIECLNQSSNDLKNACKFHDIVERSIRNSSHSYIGFETDLHINLNEPLIIERLRVLLNEPSNEIKRKALDLLSKININEPWFIESLRILLKNNENNIDYLAIKSLAKLEVKDKWFLEELLNYLKNAKDKNTLIQVERILTSYEIKEEWFIAQLKLLLTVNDFNIQHCIINILSHYNIQPSWLINYLKKWLKSKNIRLQHIAAKTLINIGIKEKWLMQHLLTWLHSEDRNDYTLAKELLTIANDIKTLKPQLQHPNKNVQERIAEIFATLNVNDEEYIRTLNSWLNDSYLKITATHILICKGHKGNKLQSIVLESLLHPQWGIQRLAVEMVGILKIKEKSVIKFLISLLTTSNPLVKQQALQTLLLLEIRENWFFTSLKTQFSQADSLTKMKIGEILIASNMKEQWVVDGLIELLSSLEQNKQWQIVDMLLSIDLKEKWFFNKILFVCLNFPESTNINSMAKAIENLVISLSSNDNTDTNIPVLDDKINPKSLEILTRGIPLQVWFRCYLLDKNKSNQKIYITCSVKRIFEHLLLAYWENNTKLIYYFDGIKFEIIVNYDFYIDFMQTARELFSHYMPLEYSLPNLNTLFLSSKQGVIMEEPQVIQERQQQQLPVVLLTSAASAQPQELTSNLMREELFTKNNLLLKEELRPVIDVIYKKDQTQLSRLLNQKRGLVLKKDIFGNIPLHYAASVGDIKIIEELLDNDHKSNINESNQFGLQPIHVAAFFGHTQTVKYLLNRGAPPVTVAIKIPLRAIKNPIHCLPLHFAVLNGQIETAIELIKSCKKEHLAQELRVQGIGNILHLAVLCRDPWALREIAYHPVVLEYPELYNELNDDDLTPIALAAAIKNNPAVKVLSQHRLITLNTLSKKIKRTVLHVAGEAGNDKAVEIVLGSVGDLQSAHSLIQIADTTPARQTAYQVAFHKMNEIRGKGKEDEKEEYEFTCNILNGFHLEIFNNLRSKPTYAKPRIRNLVFQGGGPKGIAYIGALNALDQQLRDSDWSLSNIERVAGTSAGAITAAVLALGLTPDNIRDELASMDLSALLDGVEAEKIKAVIDILNNFSQGGAVTLTGIAQIALQVTKQVYDCSNDASAAYYLYIHRKELWEQFKGFTGLCSGQAFVNWLEKLIEKWLRRILGQRIKDKAFGEEFVTSFTFGKLAKLVDDRALNCKHLYVIATCITGEPRDVIMSSEDPTWKDVKIVDAIRASMSIPGVFKPYQIDRFVDGKKISEEYLDGGMLMNAPVKLFDKVKFLKRYIHGDDDYEVFNEETLCLRLINNKSNEALKPNENFQKITTITEFLKQIINTFYEAEKIIGAAENKYQYRCIAIPDEGYGTLDFDIDYQGKEKLETSGIKTVGEFFKNYNKLKISHNENDNTATSQSPPLPIPIANSIAQFSSIITHPSKPAAVLPVEASEPIEQNPPPAETQTQRPKRSPLMESID